MASQLRIYTINRGKMDEWIRGWRKGVVPLRQKFGFRVDAAWVVGGQNKFVWILSHDGPEDWQAKQAEYYGSAERKAMDPDPARLIAHAEEWMIRSVPVALREGDEDPDSRKAS